MLATFPDGGLVGIAFGRDEAAARTIAAQHGAPVEVRRNAVVETSSGTLGARTRRLVDSCLR